jgi:ABC transporter substrate binding protein
MGDDGAPPSRCDSARKFATTVDSPECQWRRDDWAGIDTGEDHPTLSCPVVPSTGLAVAVSQLPHVPAIARRAFLAGTGAVLFAAPRAAEAQQAGKVYRIGWIIGSSISASASLSDAFRQGMRELGWVEGKNIEYEIRAAEGKLERFPAFVAELLLLKVDLFLAPTNAAAIAVRNATTTIPIVTVVASDAVETGLIDSLARPGGTSRG